MQTPVKKRLCADDPASAEKTARCTERRGVDLSSDHCVASVPPLHSGVVWVQWWISTAGSIF